MNKNKNMSSSTPKKSVVNSISKKTTNKKSKTTKSISDYKPAKADIDWSKIILAFLTPWRNPNSIFLYLLIIVSVLGKMNESP